MVAAENVLKDLYQAHSRELHRFARRCVGAQESEDMVQDVYLRLLQERKGGASIDHPRAYLFRIASNMAIDARRRARVRSDFVRGEVSLFGVTNAEAEVESFMELQELQANLRDLSPLCRKIFLLTHVEDLSHAETASRLNVSTRTVERHLAKATAHLRSRGGR